MKITNLKSIAGVLCALSLVPATVHAAQINGGISFGGSYSAEDSSDNIVSDLTLAAKLVPTANFVIDVNGDFSSVPAFTPTTSAAVLNVNPVALPADPIWSVGGFSLTLSTISEPSVTGNTLQLTGAGTLHSTDPAFDDTPCQWIATFNTAAGTFSWSSSSFSTPQQCSCTVTYTSPSTLNLNAGDVIPAVTATEDCGNGPTPVTVTLLGASTNGTCPEIITLTNGATDDCGDIITNIQTITVQCPPPPCSCTLTFTTPPAITLCAGDTIPAVTASENCGNGLTTSVAVQFLGAVTNGSCPKIITRTNSAMDNCGNFQTNIQTITVNCRGNICGHIFADCDGSGDLTAGDVGLSNVVVTLISSNNVVLGTVKTDANGGYCFTNLAGGNYTVSVAAPTGYSQTAATTSYHWKDSYGRICWQENDGYIHCLSSGTECWWDKSNCSHWKDSYGRDCWKDNYGNTHCQPCGYQTCNATTYNNKITVSLTNCTSKTDVDFAYTGSKSSVSVTCSAPSYVKCGQSYTYTCTVVNNGNVCFTGGKVCHTIGNCNNWGGWSNCTTITDNCPPLSPGQKCTFTHKCNTSYGNNGTITCQANVSCYSSKSGNCSGQNSCNAQCGW